MDPYSAAELRDIFIKKVEDNEWFIENPIPLAWFEKRKEKFSNYGRDMEILFTYTKIAHGRRIYGKPVDKRKKISAEDLEKGYQTFLENRGNKKTSGLALMYT